MPKAKKVQKLGFLHQVVVNAKENILKKITSANPANTGMIDKKVEEHSYGSSHLILFCPRPGIYTSAPPALRPSDLGQVTPPDLLHPQLVD